MSRYRPPRPPSSKFITKEGFERLRAELEELWTRKRPAVTRAVAEAAAQGDRSENAEYIYGKKQLAEIDRRVRYLRKRLDGMTVVDGPPSDTSRVYFGAWFELEDFDGNVREYRLVGPDEVGDDERYVSIDSPLGRAVRGKRIDDELTVRTPAGERSYVVIDVSYEKKNPAQGRANTGGNNR